MKKKLAPICIFLIVAAISFVNFRLFFTNSANYIPSQTIDDSLEWIDGYYGYKAAPLPRSWKFPFDTDWFKMDATEYNHLLAQSSLGMALSAFRIRNTDLINQADAIWTYLSEADFQDIKTIQYDNEPTVDTVATAMGWQQIDDFTLLAVSVCGGGYRNEWLSNFTVGDETRHVGFNSASQKVQQRIWDYIEEYDLDTTNIKIWISGFSRAAAISNITAGDLCESDVFSEETVFNYNFACPRTTKEPKAYRNIFNIIGKNDYVPMVPFGEWGFGRNGTDLYLPAPESDSEYGYLSEQSNLVMRELCNDDNRTNPGTNHILHMIMDFTVSIVPDTATYVKVFQDPLKNMWADRTANNLLTNIYGIMLSNNMLSPQDESDIQLLQSYLISKLYQEMFVGKSESDWNISLNLQTNFTREHYPDVYLAWMFSTDDPSQLFSQDEEHALISIDYSGTIDIVDENRNFLYRILPSGDILKSITDDYYHYDRNENDAVKLYISRSEDTTMIMLPLDQAYQFVLPHFQIDSEVFINTIFYNNQNMHGRLGGLFEYPSHSVNSPLHLMITPHYEDGQMTFTTNTAALFKQSPPDREYSVGYVSLMLNSYHFLDSNFRLQDSARIFGVITLLVILIGLFLVARRQGISVMFLLSGYILMCLQQIGIELAPVQVLTSFSTRIGYIASASILISCLLRLIKKHSISDILVTTGGGMAAIGCSLIEIPIEVSLILFVIGSCMVLITILINCSPDTWQWIVGATLIAGTIALITMESSSKDFFTLTSVGIVVFLLTSFIVYSFNQPGKLMFAMWLFAASLAAVIAVSSISIWATTAFYLLLLISLGWIVSLEWKEVDDRAKAKTGK